MSAPRVSVITPYLNAAATLPNTIASVQAQDFKDWELIAADDGSQDDSHALATAAALADPRIKVLAPHPYCSGAGPARNRALEAASGRYVAFLDADDLWLPKKLSIQITAMERSQTPLSCTAYLLRRPGRPDRVLAPPLQQTRKELLKGNRIGCLTAVYDTAVFGKVPMADIQRRQDYALWLKLLEKTNHALGLPEPLAIHIRRPGSLSSNPFKATLGTWQVLRNHAGLDTLRALYAMGCHISQRLRR